MPLPEYMRTDKMRERIRYSGWQTPYRISNATELAFLADIGPRIVSHRYIDGGNIFPEAAQQAGLIGGSDFRFTEAIVFGFGRRSMVLISPDNFPVAVSHDNHVVRFTAPAESAPRGSNLQKELEVQSDEVGSRAIIRYRITNRDSRPTDPAPWAPTMMRAGGRAILPLPLPTAMDKDHFQSVGPLALWSFTDFADSRWLLGTECCGKNPTPKAAFRNR